MNPGNVSQEVVHVLDGIGKLLIEKNAAYGDSALNPIRLFAVDVDPAMQIKVRIDDKLSRIARGSTAGEDVELDLLGYLMLLHLATHHYAGRRVEDFPADIRTCISRFYEWFTMAMRSGRIKFLENPQFGSTIEDVRMVELTRGFISQLRVFASPEVSLVEHLLVLRITRMRYDHYRSVESEP